VTGLNSAAPQFLSLTNRSRAPAGRDSPAIPHLHSAADHLSAFAVFNALLGCLARLFTTKQEVNDQLIFWGFFGAAVLNAVLAVQMLMYWNNSDVGAKTTRQRRRATEEGIAEPIKVPIEEKSPTGKRWARKLD
jgi:mannose-P-dolichol utilization defect protein 1